MASTAYQILPTRDLTRSFLSQPKPTACIFGGAIHAPIAHLHYNFLESLTVRVNAIAWGGYGPTVFKTIMEQVIGRET